jgi:hypothetical protein
MAADEVGRELELGVELLELGEKAMDEVVGADAAVRIAKSGLKPLAVVASKSP